MTSEPLRVSADQVRAFRGRRGHLVGPGGASAVATARALIGAQAQQQAPALWALSCRTAGRPTAATLADAVLAAGRTLVRTWGQRDTLHVYDPADWTIIAGARPGWPLQGRRVAMPRPQDVDAARAVLAASPDPITRESLFGTVDPAYLAQVEPHIVKNARWMLPADHTPVDVAAAVDRFAAGRLLWCLGNGGDACSGGKLGSQQTYADRRRWFPDLDWSLPTADQANVALVRRTLRLCAPATAADVAHFLGAKVSDVRRWLAVLSPELIPIACEDRDGLVALAADADDLVQPPPDPWPVHLLPLWDTLLMTHADKTWIAPVPAEHKAIWKKAAMVCATVLAEGRIVATWKHKLLSKRIDVVVTPLSGWRPDLLAAATARAQQLAHHLGRPEARVRLG